MTPAPPVLSYRRATVGYGDAPVVRDVDLVVEPGETLALLGPNGSGKTTLVRAALGLATVQSGALDVLGVPVRRLRGRARARIGYVPQRHSVATGVPTTVREVVACGRLARTDPLRRLLPTHRAEDRRAVDAALDAVGLGDRDRASVSELSGGQQRRVLIARAVAAEPEVLVLDEPTAGVDEESRRGLSRVLADLAAGGTTLVVVTHEVAALHGVVTRAVLLVDGRVRHDGPLAAGGSSYDEAGHHHPEEGGGAVTTSSPWLPDPSVRG